MKTALWIASGLALIVAAGSLAACNTPQQIVAAACAGASVGSAVVTADGTILGDSAAQQAAIAAGQQLITINCAAAQAAIAAIAAAQSGGPTALVAEEDRQATRLHISRELMRELVRRASKPR